MSLFRVDQFGNFKSFRGLGNYIDLFGDGELRRRTRGARSSGRSRWSPSPQSSSLLLAVILNRRFRGRAIARALLLLPWATGLVVVGLLWRWMSQPDFGAINHLLATFGLTSRFEWLADADLSFPLMVGIAIWASVPPTTLILMAGLQSIDRDFYEAAALDGARGWRVFWDFTLPLLRPVLAVSILLNVVFVFNSFPIIWTMTEGGPAGVDRHAGHLPLQARLQALQCRRCGGGLDGHLRHPAVLRHRPHPPHVAERAAMSDRPRTKLKAARPGSPHSAVLLTPSGRAAVPVRRDDLDLAQVATGPRSVPAGLATRGVALGELPRGLAIVPLAGYVKNSVIIAGGATLLNALVAIPAGFALARFRFPGRQTLPALCRRDADVLAGGAAARDVPHDVQRSACSTATGR